MSTTNWFRRLFSPSSRASSDAADPSEPTAPLGMAGAPGVSGFAGLEDSAAIKDVEESFEAPSDPAS